MSDAILDECTESLAETCPMLYHMRAATHHIHYCVKTLDILKEGTVSADELEEDGVYVVDDVGGYTVRILLEEIREIMGIFDEGTSNTEYKLNSVGDPADLIKFMMCEMSGINHPLKKAWSMSQHRETEHKCSACGTAIPNNESFVRDMFPYVNFHPSVNTGYSVPALLNNLTSWGTRTCSTGYEEVCPTCNDFARLVDFRDRFLPMDVNEERVLVCKVRSFNEKELSSLESIDREFDFTKYVNDDSGCKYLATLTGYIYEPESKSGHFQCMVKGRYYDTDYWEVDDMGDMPGIPPVDMWEQPYLMFYTIVNQGRSDQLDVPLDGNVASESRKDSIDEKIIELSGDEEDEEGREMWKFESPIGRVGYIIHKYFNTGWFKGQVVYIRDINGNRKNKADSDDGKLKSFDCLIK